MSSSVQAARAAGVDKRLLRVESEDIAYVRYKCSECGAHNPDINFPCFQCKTMPPPPLEWVCLFCQSTNPGATDVCVGCQRASGRSQRRSLVVLAGRSSSPRPDTKREWDDCGSSSMHFVTRLIKRYRHQSIETNRKRNRRPYQFSARSNVWLNRREVDTHTKGIWQPWERAMRLFEYEVRQINTMSSHDDDDDDDDGDGVGGMPFIPPSKGTQTMHLSLADVLGCRTFRGVLRTYLEENYCEENLDFLEQIEMYKAKKKGLAVADDIVNEFLKQGAPRQVNVDGQTRTKVTEQLRVLRDNTADDEDHTLFDACYEVIFNMVETDIFHRFVTSDEYIDMLAVYIESVLRKGERLKGVGWDNTQGYKSIHIDVIKGIGVSKRRTDAFVELRMDNKTQRSMTQYETRNPRFNEHFEFPLTATSQYIELNLWDEVMIGGNDFLGGVYIPIECIRTDGKMIEYFLLSTKREEGNANVQGTLQLKLSMKMDEAKVHYEEDVHKHSTTIQDMVKSKVSKSKLRYQEDGFDLDLSYITDRVIAMGFPAEGVGSMYRNRMKDVQKFFVKKHPNCYKIVNLCSELSYDSGKFNHKVAWFPFDDHNPPPFAMIPEFVLCVLKWLDGHPQNVVAVHCKAGKGRSGTMISALLLAQQSNRIATADEALALFADKRTANKKGVAIPSQRRYVRYAQTYFELLRMRLEDTKIQEEEDDDGGDDDDDDKDNGDMKEMIKCIERYNVNRVIQPKLLYMSVIRIHHIPKAVESVKTHFWFRVTCPSLDYDFTSGEHICARRHQQYDMVEFRCGRQVAVSDDVKLELFHSKAFGGKEVMFQLWFNTRFTDNDFLSLPKNELDKALKDEKHKIYHQDMELELQFEQGDLSITGGEPWVRKTDDRRFVGMKKRTSRHLYTRETVDEPYTHGVKSSAKVERVQGAFDSHMKAIQRIQSRGSADNIVAHPDDD